MAQFGVPSNVVIILNEPQLAENTGMAIRALVNTGAKRLRLVKPHHGWPNEKANLASAEKSHILQIEVFDSLSMAISDLQLVFATSARERNLIKEIYSPESACKKIENADCSVGIVFGSEKSGLSNEEISLCNSVIEIPSVDFASYNLAQAVLIICFQFARTDSTKLKTGKTELASQQELDSFIDRLEKNLEIRDHFPSPQKQILMMQTIRNLFKRANPTRQEIQSLQGVINSLISEQACK